MKVGGEKEGKKRNSEGKIKWKLSIEVERLKRGRNKERARL